jgi:hydrogenase nickel incorporation protein HypA/HybF
MHELSIAWNILEIVRQHAPDGHGTDVRAVRVRIGPLAGVVPESLEFCFQALVRETPLQHAVLQIDRIAIRYHCQDCGTTGELQEPEFRCPACAGAIRLSGGDELQVVEIELADSAAEVP